MSIIDTLVTDRTQADVDFLQTLHNTPVDEWGGEPKAGFAVAGQAVVGEGWLEWYNRAISKGAYNYTDLNRVGAALQYLSEILSVYGYQAPVTARKDWTDQNWAGEFDTAAYLADVDRIRRALTLKENTPGAPETMVGLTIDAANNIEKILLAVQDAIIRLKSSFFYSGEIFSGEV